MAQQAQKLVFAPLFFNAFFLHPLALGDVPIDFQDANGSVVARNELKPGRDDYLLAVFGSVTEFTLPFALILQNCFGFGARNWENGVEQVVRILADCLAFSEAIKRFGSPVPAFDHTVKPPNEDSVK